MQAQVRSAPADVQKVGHLVFFSRACAALVLWLFAVPALAGAIALDAGTRSVEAWPALRVLADPSGVMSAREALARRAEFTAPAAPHANLGPRAEPVWILMNLRSAADAPRQWVLSVDYASIDRIEIHAAPASGAAPLLMGRALPFSQHPIPSAVHAATLMLEPGTQHELLLRVQTRSSMLLPIVISTPEAFHAREAHRQLVQGLMAGAMLCLLLYSLIQWTVVRDGLFFAYALVIGGTGLFFFSYSGLGPQHLWGDNEWLSVNLAPMAVLVAIVGGCWFVERALQVRLIQPRLARGLHVHGHARDDFRRPYGLGDVVRAAGIKGRQHQAGAAGGQHVGAHPGESAAPRRHSLGRLLPSRKRLRLRRSGASIQSDQSRQCENQHQRRSQQRQKRPVRH